MHSLELETAMDEIKPSRAIHVQRSAELALRESFGITQIGGRHAPMRQSDLNVERHSDNVGDQDKCNARGPVGEGTPEEAVAEPEPIAGDESDLGRAYPMCHLTPACWRVDQVVNREYVEVEASYSHDRVVGVLLILDSNVGDFVPCEGEVVVR